MPIIGSKYLVIGGAGPVGSSLTRALADAGETVIVADWMGGDDGAWSNLPGNLDDLWADGTELNARLEKHWRDISAIACFGSGPSLQDGIVSTPRELWDTACQRQRPFFWGSTLQVYGNTADSDRQVADPATYNPVTPFGRAARVFERFVHQHRADADAPPVATALRIDTVWSQPEERPVFADPGQSFEAGRMMADIVRQHLQGPFDIVTDGKVVSLAN